MRDLAGRSVENSQCWVSPQFELADKYQSTVTGDYCPSLVPLNPSTTPDARTRTNSALNPQSYANRDYRMKSTIMWDYEVCMGLMSKKETGWVPFIYKTWGADVVINGKTLTSYNTDGTNSGYVFRKFVRNYAGEERGDGDFNWPVIRLADVFLMYAEADNKVNGPQAYAIDLVNRVRHRGNLPPLTADKTSSADKFFDAIKQERIVELVGEGQRAFDTRRWREIEKVWCEPGGTGRKLYDTWGAQVAEYYVNQNNLAYERCYIFQIPESERNKNPNLTQNKPFR
ncbi:MAG: RagB/SusD family nutrient uptake outer membrane protein [Paraprevotella sp.]|nr:RagB/SusD family nutrient uptake outer membrane protein [Paraprevotella sp.]